MAFGVSAADELGGGGQFGDEFRRRVLSVRKRASGAAVPGGAGEPDEAAAGVHDELHRLRRRAEAEQDGVAAVAAREERRFGDIIRRRENRIVVRGSSVGGFRVFEVVGSGERSRGEGSEGLDWI